MSKTNSGRKTTRMLKPTRGVNILSKFSQNAARIDTLPLAKLLIHTIKTEFGISKTQVFLQDNISLKMAESTGTRTPVREIKLKPSAQKYLAEHREPVTLTELAGNRKLKEIVSAFGKNQPSLIFPMTHRGSLVGLCIIGSAIERGPLSLAERELLTAMANQAGLSLGASKTVKKAKEVTRMLKKAKKEKEVFDAHKDNFVRITCHEINTPLTVINLSANMLLDDTEEELTRNQKNLVREIIENTTRLAEVNNDLVHLARRGAVSAKTQSELCSFEEIVMLVLEKMSILFAKRPDLDVQFSVDEAIPPLFVSPRDIVRALVNIIQNSIKFTREENGRISITAEFRKGSVVCTISDNGIGIKKKYHNLVFEPFVELVEQNKRSTGKTRFLGAGLGLGLTIAKDIIENYGGNIRMESLGENMGTTVYVTLPVYDDAD